MNLASLYNYFSVYDLKIKKGAEILFLRLFNFYSVLKHFKIIYFKF